MRYWDSSALVPLVIREPSTASLRRLARDGDMVTWCLSLVEISSAIERRAREGALSQSGREIALEVLIEMSATWSEVTAVGQVRDRACRLLGVHQIRAADAMQLAAALVATADRPSGHEFVCADLRLCEAARREGFRLLNF